MQDVGRHITKDAGDNVFFVDEAPKHKNKVQTLFMFFYWMF
jgi:hypothetical protein